MNPLQKQIADLPTRLVGTQPHLSYQVVTDTVAAFLFPTLPQDQIDEAGYQRILETADTLCRELGYGQVVKLTPPDVDFSDMGLYWSAASQLDLEPESILIHVGPGLVEMLEDGQLVDAGYPADASLSQLGLDEVTRQHFKIPVTASAAVIDLLHQAVASDWPNDYKGVWHDILGMCIVGGQDINPNERLFSVIIRGLGRRRYWQFKAQLQQDNTGAPFLCISLADDRHQAARFELGHVVMTPGATALRVDFTPYMARHAVGDWGELDAFDKQQNETAVKDGYRILSAYNVPLDNDEPERIWIITESDRSCTTILLPSEY